MKRLRIAALAMAALLAPLVISCGSHGGGDGTGSLKVTVIWPAKSRLIPAASNSINASVGVGGQQLDHKLLARPGAGSSQVSAVFTNLSPGVVHLDATAFPNADGTGVAQADGSVPATITAGQTTNVTLTMASTIVRVAVTPANPTVIVGADQPLSATCYDAGDNVVLVANGNISWQSANTGLLTVNASTGVAHGVGAAPNGVQVTATESESQKSGTTMVTVTSQSAGCSDPTPNPATGIAASLYPKAGGNSLGGWNNINGNGGVGNIFGWQLTTAQGGGSYPVIGITPALAPVAYITSGNDGAIRSVNPATGAVNWTFSIQDATQNPAPNTETTGLLGFTPLVGKDTHIYFCSLNKTYALDKDGHLLWVSNVGGASLTMGVDGTIFGENSVALFALNPATGVAKWFVNTTQATGRFGTNNTIPLNSHGEAIVATTTAGSVVNLTRVDVCGGVHRIGTVAMNAATVGPDDTIYVTSDWGGASLTNHVTAYDSNGGIKWGPVACPVGFTPPALDTANNRLYVLDHFGTLTSINTLTGAIVWQHMIDTTTLALPNTGESDGMPVVMSSQDIAYVSAYHTKVGNVRKGSVLFINKNDGSEIFRADLPNGVAPSFGTPIFTGLGSVIVQDSNSGTVVTLQ